MKTHPSVHLFRKKTNWPLFFTHSTVVSSFRSFWLMVIKVILGHILLCTHNISPPISLETKSISGDSRSFWLKSNFVLKPLSSRCIQQASTKLLAAPTTVIVIRRLLSYRRYIIVQISKPISSAKYDSTRFLCILLGRAFLCTCICIQ